MAAAGCSAGEEEAAVSGGSTSVWGSPPPARLSCCSRWSHLRRRGEEGEIALLERGGEGYENVSYKSEKPRPLSSPANPAQCPALVSALPAPLPQPRSSCRRGQQSPWGRGRRGAPWLGWLLPTPVPGGHSRTVLRAASPPAVLPGCLAGGPREGAAARPANVGRISGPGQKKEPKHNMSSAHAHTDTQPSHWAAWGRLVCPCGRGSPGHRNWHASPSRGRWGREELPRLGRRGALAGHRSWEK